jgi:hypothetical protein
MKEQVRAEKIMEQIANEKSYETWGELMYDNGEQYQIECTKEAMVIYANQTQTTSLMIAMLDSQLKVEEIKYLNSKFDVYSGECFKQVKNELVRQLNELKG